ncbi:hypothetical protein [Streptomyces sp. CB01881]|uniref:hypothetical protein n=1 Tax=Streptomyces sp. CB01881 TaxID=2078691 RepID=UPI000CDBF05E|nr:hypothetical protein [Streptomyces sp. CB01881]AUY48656.1 hypothetical protein C2142_06525 [Streptomyces sp. CB01881]TYC77150.1 hypothetical protein EH183_06530 [Streptomyces sp. CB01881]
MSVARRRRRLPDEVRTAAVRAVLCLAFTLVGLLVATLASFAGSWLLTPALMAMGLGVFGSAWCLLEIMISRQVAAQRMRGPNSASPMAGSRAPSGPRPLPRPAGPPPPGGTPPGGPAPRGPVAGGPPRQPRVPTA